ncbi:MAG: thiamine pyrophosphate-binding protein [Leptospirales bacterium]
MGQTVSDQIVEFLLEAGVRYVFGIPGDTIDSLMEALRKKPELKFILVRHEETGAFAASAQAKLSGRLAVCVGCQGPGAIHLLNGLYDAALDRVPVLAITGQVDSSLIGTRTVQEINQIGLFSDVAVYNHEVRSPKNLPLVLEEAIRMAYAGPGVAHLSIPSDIMQSNAFPDAVPMESVLVGQRVLSPEPSPVLLQEFANVLGGKKRVTILYGDGARGAKEPLLALADTLNAPLVYTTRSKDIVSNDHPHVMGGIGLMGSRAGNQAVNHAEVLLVVGSSFAFREYYPEGIPILQIDRDPSRIGLHVPATHGLVSSSARALERLNEMVVPNLDRTFLDHCTEHHLSEWKLQKGGSPGPSFLGKVPPDAVMRGIGKRSLENTVYCVDSGTVTVLANNFPHIREGQRFLWSWNLGSLACALPYALGAGLLNPDNPVVVLAGDGGFEMLMGDLSTLAQYQIPVLIVVFNNGTLRFIEYEEMRDGNPPWGTRFVNPDYVRVAEAFGFRGIRVEYEDQLEEALDQAFSANKTVIVDVLVDPEALWIPPVLNARMVTGYLTSKIRSFFAKSPPELPS